MAKTKFPLTISAVQKRDRSLWEIGDALVAECGAPPEDGINDGSYELMQAVAAEIEGLKIGGYSVNYLRDLRRTANAWPPARRRAGYSFSVHLEARTPEMLKVIVDVVPKGEPVTRDYVREMRNEIEAQQADDIRDELGDDYKEPPVKRPPSVEDARKAATQVAIQQATHKIMALIAGAQKAEQEARALLEKHLTSLLPEAYPAMVEQSLIAANQWRDFSAAAGRTHKEHKRGHLHAV